MKLNVRALVEPLLPKLVTPELGVEANFRRVRDYALHELGLPNFYRRKNALADIREVLGIPKSKKTYESTRKEYLIPEDAYVESSKDIRNEYQHVVEFYGYDPETGQRIELPLTIGSDRRLPKWQLEQKAQELMESETLDMYEGYSWHPEGFKIVELRRRRQT